MALGVIPGGPQDHQVRALTSGSSHASHRAGNPRCSQRRDQTGVVAVTVDCAGNPRSTMRGWKTSGRASFMPG